MTPAQLQILKTEITTDPLTRGYAGKSDVEVADLLNLPDRTPDVDDVDTGLLRSCFVAADWATLTVAQKERLNFLLGSPTVDVPSHIRQELRALFPTGNATRNNLMAATRRAGSRGQELGIGGVTPSDVADAKRLP